MKKQYKVYYIGRDMPGDGVKIVHAESESEAKKIARQKFPYVDIVRAEVLR